MNYQYQQPYASQPGDGYSPFGGAGVNSASGFGGLGGNPGVPGTPGAQPTQRWWQVQENGHTRLFTGVTLAIGYVVSIWLVFFINTGLGNSLSYYGIHPLDLSSVWHVVTAPLLHLNLQHIMSNTVPGAIFVFLIGLSGKRTFWEVTLFSLVVGGAGTWLFGGVGTNHIGASGLIYGWLGYLVIRGFANRSVWQIVMGLFLAFSYSGLIWGVLPTDTGVSWQGHLFGGIGGVLAGMVITSDDPPETQQRRAQGLTGR